MAEDLKKAIVSQTMAPMWQSDEALMEDSVIDYLMMMGWRWYASTGQVFLPHPKNPGEFMSIRLRVPPDSTVEECIAGIFGMICVQSGTERFRETSKNAVMRILKTRIAVDRLSRTELEALNVEMVGEFLKKR